VSQVPQNYEGEVLDFGDQMLLPALVDTHVHVNEPGRTEWEGFLSATRSAAAGGITTLIDMPLNCSPVTVSKAALEEKVSQIQGKTFVDVGFWGGVIPGSVKDLPELCEAGIFGVKSFMIDSGLDEFPPLNVEQLEEAMTVLKENDLPYLVHAEYDTGEGDDEGDAQSYGTFLNSRPRSFENKAIEILVDLCAKTGCKTHVVHLSSSDAIELIKNAKQQLLPFSAETCPHYLTLASETIENGQTQYKCCPPIREQENQDKLWEGLQDAVIDFVVSDHSPCTPELKLLDAGDMEKAWGGIASLQLGLLLVWTKARSRGIPLEQVVQWMCLNPARFLGIDHRKGSLFPGKDADIIVFDPDFKQAIKAEMIHHRHKITPYENQEVYGKVRATYLRGQAVYKEETFSDSALGKLLWKGKL